MIIFLYVYIYTYAPWRRGGASESVGRASHHVTTCLPLGEHIPMHNAPCICHTAAPFHSTFPAAVHMRVGANKGRAGARRLERGGAIGGAAARRAGRGLARSAPLKCVSDVLCSHLNINSNSGSFAKQQERTFRTPQNPTGNPQGAPARCAADDGELDINLPCLNNPRPRHSKEWPADLFRRWRGLATGTEPGFD